ncbi:MAG: archaeosortase/exosortase family protein [Candidatus Zixiibacteriota bacterium]
MNQRRTSKSVSAPARRRWSMPWRAIRAVGVFAIIAGVWFWSLNVEWLLEHVWRPYTSLVSIVAGGIFKLSGAQVQGAGASLSVNGTALTVEFGCNGLEAAGLYLAAVLASAVPWKRKLAGLGIGVVAIFLINQIRVCGLYLAAMAGGSWFDFAHIIVGQTFVIVLTMGVFLWWDSRDDRRGNAEVPPVLA